jgi:hypothetical protein
MPLVEMVPTELLPPLMPLTLHETPLFVVPTTVAVSCNARPSSTLAVGGVSEIETAGGGGGGVPELAPPPAQPGRLIARITRSGQETVFVLRAIPWRGERDRMPGEKQD